MAEGTLTQKKGSHLMLAGPPNALSHVARTRARTASRRRGSQRWAHLKLLAGSCRDIEAAIVIASVMYRHANASRNPGRLRGVGGWGKNSARHSAQGTA